jgi:hypothetical protein
VGKPNLNGMLNMQDFDANLTALEISFAELFPAIDAALFLTGIL